MAGGMVARAAYPGALIPRRLAVGSQPGGHVA